jgi:hypothetical protein
MQTAQEVHRSIQSGRMPLDHIHNCVGLIEHHLCDIAKLVKFDGTVTREAEMRYARIRELNAEVRTLKKQLGQATPLDGLGALITDIDDKMSKFWRGMGFSFPDVQFGKYSIKATFRVRFEMHASDMSNKPFSIKQLRQARAEEIEKAGVETAYIRDEREMSFFDSENNRTYFISLLKDAFPDIRIEKFQNRLARDGGTKMSGVAADRYFIESIETNINYSDLPHFLEHFDRLKADDKLINEYDE